MRRLSTPSVVPDVAGGSGSFLPRFSFELFQCPPCLQWLESRPKPLVPGWEAEVRASVPSLDCRYVNLNAVDPAQNARRGTGGISPVSRRTSVRSTDDLLRLGLLLCGLLANLGPIYQFIGSMIWFHQYLGDYQVFSGITKVPLADLRPSCFCLSPHDDAVARTVGIAELFSFSRCLECRRGSGDHLRSKTLHAAAGHYASDSSRTRELVCCWVVRSVCSSAL